MTPHAEHPAPGRADAPSAAATPDQTDATEAAARLRDVAEIGAPLVTVSAEMLRTVLDELDHVRYDRDQWRTGVEYLREQLDRERARLACDHPEPGHVQSVDGTVHVCTACGLGIGCDR